MKSPLLLLLFLFLFLFSLTFSAGDSAGDSPLKPTDFIRTSCNTTLYPEICFSSLSRYANAVQQNPGQLARVAISLTLSKAHRMASYISNLTRDADYEANSRAASALRDCFTNVADASDEIRGSLRQIRQIAAASGVGSFRFQMSNVQTWMSAALTDEETCTDGFEDVAADNPVKADVCDKVTDLKKFTSNALALVNNYANTGTP